MPSCSSQPQSASEIQTFVENQYGGHPHVVSYNRIIFCIQNRYFTISMVLLNSTFQLQQFPRYQGVHKLFNCLRPSYLMNMCQPVTSNLHRSRLRSTVRMATSSFHRSMQLCCRWAVHVKCATSTTTQRQTLCHVISSPAED